MPEPQYFKTACWMAFGFHFRWQQCGQAVPTRSVRCSCNKLYSLACSRVQHQKHQHTGFNVRAVGLKA
jgi:hypothetical protein